MIKKYDIYTQELPVYNLPIYSNQYVVVLVILFFFQEILNKSKIIPEFSEFWVVTALSLTYNKLCYCIVASFMYCSFYKYHIAAQLSDALSGTY